MTVDRIVCLCRECAAMHYGRKMPHAFWWKDEQ